MAAAQVLRSEWTKIKSVNSTALTLSLAVVVSAGLGMLVSALSNNDFDNMSRESRLTFDPTYISFSGLSLGQLAMVVFGVLVVASEYSTGMIRTSLAAVPQRGRFLFGKIAVASLLVLAVALVTSFASFFLGQLMLGDHSTDLGAPNVLRAVIGAAVYMTLVAMFSMGIATMLRSPMLSLGILMPFFFLISPILGSVSATKKVAQYFPDQAGQRIMQVVTPANDDVAYGPWGGLAILLVWVAAALLIGYALLKKRDA
ncbi:ABC transporter permease subunit [Streptomyces sp. cg28]|uniref:ABC transporter permease subunit n=1 Tax=unclassified Streptomyces TaxID=2593676 RepID=UPI000DBA5DEE|nr:MULTISPECIES: ABC transporter permease subunit [unclassified Streptomyces]MYT72407.1 ABC transporter permease subunit [Streptomyces sp. SID8367]RAJ70974.1 ABC-2 type transport system permease protein [Streptomyces sp. PsTaAH-137]